MTPLPSHPYFGRSFSLELGLIAPEAVSFFFIGFEKKYTEIRIKLAPIENCGLRGVPKSMVETPVAKQTLTPVARPFRT